MTDAGAPHAAGAPQTLSKHRIEALTDGIFAVAMTLLVIELKVPDPHAIATSAQLRDALSELLPKALAWIISFYVLAIFWLSHHRLFQLVRHVDRGLLWRNLHQLALISLLPFSASMLGEYGGMREAYWIYNGNMLLLSLASLAQLVHVHRHPEIQAVPTTRGRYHAALVRIVGLAGCAIASMALALAIDRVPYVANYAYLAMWPIGLLSRRIAARDAHAAALSHPS